MSSRIRRLAGLGIAVASAAVPSLLLAQDTGSQQAVFVLEFDQVAVMESAREVFGGEYALGRGIAQLVAARLAEEGVIVSTDGGGAAGTVEGTILVFGKAEGSGEAGGVSLGRLRVGVGRRAERALVALEARLVDGASGQIVTMASGQGESDRGGWNAFARVRGGPDLATVDLSSEQFRETAIGEATHQAVGQICDAIAHAVDQLGTFAAPEPEPEPEPMPDMRPVAPTGGEPVIAGGPVGTFAWAPYQFRGTEHFRYDVRQTEDGTTETGYYQLDLEPAGTNRVRMRVDGQVGDETYRSSVTTGVGSEGMQMGMGQFMTLGPVGLTLLNPVAWMMLSGHEMTVGDEWSYGSGGESVSIRVERECQAAGQGGLLIVFRENQEVRQESCVAPDVALPLRLLMNDEYQRIELTLVEYRP